MPVRTSAVVAVGVALLTAVGAATIFGDSLMAMLAPSPAAPVSGATPGPGTSLTGNPDGKP